MASVFGGKVVGCDHREYGFAQVDIIKLGSGHELADRLFAEFDGSIQVCNHIPSISLFSLPKRLGLDVSW